MEWFPIEIIKEYSEEDENGTAASQYAIILLNQPILREQNFSSLWNKAAFRVSVDGGGNRWDAARKNYSNLVFPEVASGDFDSIRNDVMELFKQNVSTEVIPTPDQSETDFTKAVRVLADKIKDNTEITKVIVFCESSGRFDQIMANIETLYHSLNILPDKALFLMGSSSITWLLPAGSHNIHCGRKEMENFKIQYCSLIPIGSPCKVTTSGLAWNLNNDTLAFGQIVSTSNEVDYSNSSIDDHIVTIENSDPLLWSMELELYSQV